MDRVLECSKLLPVSSSKRLHSIQNTKYREGKEKRGKGKYIDHIYISYVVVYAFGGFRDFKGPVGFMGPAPDFVMQMQTVQILQTSNIKLPRLNKRDK